MFYLFGTAIHCWYATGLIFLACLVVASPCHAKDLLLSGKGVASKGRPAVPSGKLVFKSSQWDDAANQPGNIMGSLQLEPTSPGTPFGGGHLVARGMDHLVFTDTTGFQPVRFHAGRGNKQGNYGHWHESYFMSDGFTHLVNIGNTNEDGESGIRFWKGKESNQWVVIIPSQPGYKLAIIRDGLVDAMVFDEEGRVIIGQLPPNDYGPPQARLHVCGMVNEKQFFVEAAESQQNAVFEVTGWQGNKKYLVITANGNVGIGTNQPHGSLDVAGSIYFRRTAGPASQVTSQDRSLDSIAEHAKKMQRSNRLPALPNPQFDTQDREVVDLAAHQGALVKELETAHLYIAQLSRELQQLRSQVKRLANSRAKSDP